MSKFYTTKVFINNKFFRNALAIAESISDAKEQFAKIKLATNHTIGDVTLIRHYTDGHELNSNYPVLIMDNTEYGVSLFGTGRM